MKFRDSVRLEIYARRVDDDFLLLSAKGVQEPGLDRVSAANERNVRAVIESGFPPLQIYGTTGRNWQAAVIRHMPLEDPCSCCLFAAHEHLRDRASHRRRIVRHGHLPERAVQTGIGAVRVRVPRVRDRDPGGAGGRIHFTASILPPYLRRAKSIEELLPWLYLKGISTGDFGEALAALLRMG